MLTFGVAPRLTVVVPVALAVLGYLLDTLGSALDWPNAVLSISPFHHLARPLAGSALFLTRGQGDRSLYYLRVLLGRGLGWFDRCPPCR